MENIHFFFSDKAQNGRLSTLNYALNQLQEMEAKGLENSQPYCMYIWSVLDLLSRFYSGQLDNQQATKRLKKYLTEFFPHERKQTKNLILFRNACSHSVSLFASDASSKREVRFALEEQEDFIRQKSSSRIIINGGEFKLRLLKSIERYQSQLKKDEQLQKRFEKVFRKMGYVNS